MWSKSMPNSRVIENYLNIVSIIILARTNMCTQCCEALTVVFSNRIRFKVFYTQERLAHRHARPVVTVVKYLSEHIKVTWRFFALLSYLNLFHRFAESEE